MWKPVTSSFVKNPSQMKLGIFIPKLMIYFLHFFHTHYCSHAIFVLLCHRSSLYCFIFLSPPFFFLIFCSTTSKYQTWYFLAINYFRIILQIIHSLLQAALSGDFATACVFSAFVSTLVYSSTQLELSQSNSFTISQEGFEEQAGSMYLTWEFWM